MANELEFLRREAGVKTLVGLNRFLALICKYKGEILDIGIF
jgi:hypothetical protein